MAYEHMVLFPICIREYKGVVKMYIPAIDMETRAKDYLDALNKARMLLKAHMALDDINADMVMKDPCSSETVMEFLEKRCIDDYYDAQIVFVDYDMQNGELSDLGEFTVNLPQYLINDIQNENIECGIMIEKMLQEAVRRKRLYNQVKDWIGKTVEICTDSGNAFYGKIRSVKHEEDTPWVFSIRLQTGMCDWKQIDSSVIDEINEVPVVMNEYGTFHLADQGGMISLSGVTWWKKGHVDVYLEYDPSLELEDQKAFKYLAKFNKTKYGFDESLRQVIAKQLMERDEILALFEDLDEEDPLKRDEIILDHLINRIELWFIDVSSNDDLYMDYNFSNAVGSFSVGVMKKADDSFMFKLNGVRYNDEEDQDEDQDE